MEGSDLDIHRPSRARRIHREHGADSEGKISLDVCCLDGARWWVHADTALVINQRSWLDSTGSSKEIHTDTALTTNREYGLDSIARRARLGRSDLHKMSEQGGFMR
jgi:hypothetical protein